MLLFFIFIFCSYTLAPAADYDSISKKMLLRHLLSSMPEHPQHGHLINAPVEQSAVFAQAFPHETAHILSTIDTITAQYKRRNLSANSIDRLCIKMQNDEITESAAQKELIRILFCIAEHLEELRPSSSSPRPILQQFLLESNEFNWLNTDILNQFSYEITWINQFLYFLNSPDAPIAQPVQAFFMEIGDIHSELNSSQTMFDYIQQKCEFLADETIPLLINTNSSEEKMLPLLFGILNPAKITGNKKRCRSGSMFSAVYTNPDLAKLFLLRHNRNPHGHSSTVSLALAERLVRWRYDLFHSIEETEEHNDTNA